MRGIVAVNRLGVIGHEGGIPWPMMREDMRHFVEVTRSAPVLVGRKTWETLPERALLRLGARVLVVTSQTLLGVATVKPHLPSILERVHGFEEVTGHEMVCIGGAQLYQLMSPVITTWDVTHVEDHSQGDTTIPAFWVGLPITQAKVISGGVIRRWGA